MTKVAGLTPFTEDRPSVSGRNSGRVEVPQSNIRPQRLSPTANPVNRYARPAIPDGNNNWKRLAESLSTFNPKIREMLDQQAEEEKLEAENLANRRLGGMSFEEANEAVKAGTIPEMSNPWFKAAFMKQYGERLGHQRASEIAAYYETEFDRENGNLDQYIAERMKEDLDEYGSDKFFSSSYLGVMNRFNVSAQGKHQEHLTEQTKNETFQGAYETFLGTARQLMDEKATPQEIVDALKNKYQGNNDLLKIPYHEQDKELLRVAQTLAEEGNLDLVREILNSEQFNADGSPRSSLATNREFSTDAARILQKAERVTFDNNEKNTFDKRMSFFDQSFTGDMSEEELTAFHKETPGAFTDGQYQTLVARNRSVKAAAEEAARKQADELLMEEAVNRSVQTMEMNDMAAAEAGLAAFIEDGEVLTKSGETKTVSADERKKTLVKNIEENLRAKVDKGELTPEQAFEAEVRLFSNNGLENPQWKSVLTAGGMSATTFNLSSDELPPALKDGAELYLQLHAKNPALLEKHVTDRTTSEFYEAFRTAKQVGRMTDDQAFQQATNIIRDPAKYEGPHMRQRWDDITRAVNSLASNGFMQTFADGNTPSENAGYVGNEISRNALFYAKIGLGTKEAIEQAKERFQNTHTQINGWWVNTADKETPPDFKGLVEKQLQDYVDENGKEEGVELSDLTIVPATNGSGGWQIVYKLIGTPVENREKRYFTNNTLIANEKARIEKERADRIAAHEANITSGKYDPWLVISDKTYFGPYLGANPSQAEQELVHKRAKEISEEKNRKK